MSHPLPTVDIMDFTAVIIIVVAVILVGFAVVAAVRHRDRSVEEVVKAAVALVASEAREAFDARLSTGKTELEQRSRAIDEQVRGFKDEAKTMRDALVSMQTNVAEQQELEDRPAHLVR